MEYSEATYIYNNINYNVCATNDIHERLQNDVNFFNEYFANNVTSSEALGVTEKNNNDITKTFNWTQQSTKFLLEKYNERKTRFHDPKIKKKLLWSEIVTEFKSKNYYVNEDILDQKMRNLKKSYRNILDNNKKTSTGRGRISWEWYKDMEEIYQQDCTVHIGPTLSSMSTENNAVNESSCTSTPTTTCEYQNTLNSLEDDTIRSKREVSKQFIENELSERCVKMLLLDTHILINSYTYISDWFQSCAKLNFGIVNYDIYQTDKWCKNTILKI